MEDNNNQDRLEIQIVAAVQQALTAINSMNTSFKQTNAELKITKINLDKLGNVKSINIAQTEINFSYF